MRLLLEIARAVRAALPQRMMVGARLSASEWVDGGFAVEEAVVVARALKEIGVAYICVLERRQFAKAKIPLDAALPGAVRRKDPARGRHRRHAPSA